MRIERPWALNSLTFGIKEGETRGLPKRLPLDLALLSPALTRSRIISFSNSATAPITLKSSLPDEVEVLSSLS